MNRILLGALAALLLTAAGVFWWQGRAATERGAPPPDAALASAAAVPSLPNVDGKGLRGAPPPEATEITREERRFNRIDRNRDNMVTRVEMLIPRAAMFRALDKDGNNLLSFEEWAVKTSDRFHAADRNRDQKLDRGEFVATRPKPAAQPKCQCAPAVRVVRKRAIEHVEPVEDEDEADPEV